MEYTSSSCVWKNQIAYILCVSRRVHWYALPPCTLWKALASDTNPVPPLAEFCVPCVPSGTETKNHRPKAVPTEPPKPPCLPPGGPVQPVSTPGGERTRPCPVRGRFGPHRAQFGRKKRKQPNPEDNRQRNRRIRQLSTSHQANGFPKTRSGERCEKRAGERPGVAHRRPVPGHFVRQSRSLRDFSQASISPFSGVDLEALES